MTAGAPGVSVVVPTRARPAMLERAVESALAQDHPGVVEVVVVHDGEDPGQHEARDTGDRRVVPLRNDRARGAAGARNCGLLAATQPLVALCDDDDVWLPGKLSAQLAALRAEPAAIGCGGGWQLRQGDATTPKVPALDRVTHADLLRSRVADVHPSTLVLHRERLLSSVGLLDEQVPGSYGEDYDWLLRATTVGDLVVVRRPLAEVLWHEGSYFGGDWETTARAIRYLLDKHPDLAAHPRGRARLLGRLAFAHAALGRRRPALQHAVAALRSDPRERRAYLALAAGLGVARPATLVRLANAAGKGL